MRHIRRAADEVEQFHQRDDDKHHADGGEDRHQEMAADIDRECHRQADHVAPCSTSCGLLRQRRLMMRPLTSRYALPAATPKTMR